MDYDDWYITYELVNITSDKNNKCLRFNSKFLCPNTEPVNAISSDWSNKNNLLVPLIFLIPKAFKHFLASESSSRAILVCPYWVSTTFWSMLLQNKIHFHLFVKDFLITDDVQRYVKLGDNENSCIASDKFKEFLITFLLIK